MLELVVPRSMPKSIVDDADSLLTLGLPCKVDRLARRRGRQPRRLRRRRHGAGRGRGMEIFSLVKEVRIEGLERRLRRRLFVALRLPLQLARQILKLRHLRSWPGIRRRIREHADDYPNQDDRR